MNTSLLGSSLVCILNHALRAAATSGRSCSAACRLFFKAEAQMTKEAEDRGLADRQLLLRHSHLEFGQRDVRLCVHPSRNPRPVPLQRIAFVTTKLLRLDTPAATPTREKATDRTDTHPAQFRSLFIRVARLDCLNYATPQVLRIWLAHSCWPPCPVGSLNHNQRFMGMPDSTFPQNALVARKIGRRTIVLDDDLKVFLSNLRSATAGNHPGGHR